MRRISLILFPLALLVTGVLGTETRLLFFWPGCLLLGLAGLTSGLRWKIRMHFPPSDWCLLSVLLLGAYLAARAWFSPVVAYAREDLYLVLGCFTAYVLTITAASHPRWRMVLFVTLLVIAAGNLAVGFVHFSGNWSFHVVPHFARSFTEGRIGGFYNNPNHLAAFFSFVVFLCAGVVCFGRASATWKLLLGFLAFAFTIGMSLTISRAALLGLLCGGLVFAAVGLYLVWKTQRHLFGRIIIGASVLLVIGGAGLYKVNEEYLRKRIESQPTATDAREHVWNAALAQHAQSAHPLIGDGARSFYDGGIRHRTPETPAWTGDALFAHNEFLQTLVDYGWLGIMLFVLALLTHLFNGLRFLHWFANWRFHSVGLLSSNSLAFSAASIAALAATLVHAVFEFHWHVAATAITGSILFGILANPGFSGPEHIPTRLPGARLIAKLAMIAASFAMVWGALTTGRADYFSAQADIAAKDKNHAAQIKDLTRAIEIDARNFETWYQRGVVWLEQSSAEKSQRANERAAQNAAADLAQSAQLNPQSYLVAVALADAQDLLGKREAAEKSIAIAIANAPTYEEPRLALAFHYEQQRDWKSAERAYLWAMQAPTANRDKTLRWNDGYFRMIERATKAAKRDALTKNKPPP